MVLLTDGDHHAIALHGNRLFDFDSFTQGLYKRLQNHARAVAVLVLPAAQDHLDFHAMAFGEKLDRAVAPDIGIVVADGQRKPNPLDFNAFLLGAILAFLPLLLVLKTPKVDNTADRRLRERRNLDKVEGAFLRRTECNGQRQNAELLVILVNDADFRNADLVVNAKSSFYCGGVLLLKTEFKCSITPGTLRELYCCRVPVTFCG